MPSQDDVLTAMRSIGGKIGVSLVRRPLPRKADIYDRTAALSWKDGVIEEGEDDAMDKAWRKSAFHYRVSLSGPCGGMEFDLWLGAGLGSVTQKVVRGAASNEYISTLVDTPNIHPGFVLSKLLQISGFSGDGYLEYLRMSGNQRNDAVSRAQYKRARSMWDRISGMLGPDSHVLVKAKPISKVDGSEDELF